MVSVAWWEGRWGRGQSKQKNRSPSEKTSPGPGLAGSPCPAPSLSVNLLSRLTSWGPIFPTCQLNRLGSITILQMCSPVPKPYKMLH